MVEKVSLPFIEALKEVYPKVAGVLNKVNTVSLTDFISNHELGYFTDTQEARDRLDGKKVSDLSLSEVSDLFVDVVLPRTPHVVISGGAGNVSLRIVGGMDRFVYTDTSFAQLTKGVRSLLDTDTVLASLIENKLVTVEIVQDTITKDKSVYSVILYRNDMPTLGVKELKAVREDAKTIQEKNNMIELQKVFSPSFKLLFNHDSHLITQTIKGGITDFSMLASPNKPSREQANELERKLLILNIGREYQPYLTSTPEDNLLLSFFNTVKKSE